MTSAHRDNDDMAHVKAPKSSELKELVAARFAAAVRAYHPVQAQVARDLGVTPQQLSAALNGRNYPDEALVVKFCDLTGCTADWIYRGMMKSEMPVETAIHIALEAPHLVRKESGSPVPDESPVSAES